MWDMTHSYVCHDSFICSQAAKADKSDVDDRVEGLKAQAKRSLDSTTQVAVCCSVLQCLAVFYIIES